MHRFYCPDIASTLTLGEEDSKHCVKVLRMAEGDTIEVVDGNGNLYTCRITMAHPKRCGIEVLAVEHQPPHWSHKIVLGIAPTKNLDRHVALPIAMSSCHETSDKVSLTLTAVTAMR